MGPKKSSKPNKGTKIGKIVLKNEASDFQKNLVTKLGKSINLNGFRWEVVNGKFLEFDFGKILTATEQLNINHLGITNNKHPQIIKDLIILPSYHKLQNLIMRQNNIESLQPITRLYCPLLWRIDTRQNNIVSLDSLSKSNWPELVMLVIGDNRISDIQIMSNYSFKKVIDINLEGNINLTDIRTVLKMQLQNLEQLYAQGSNLIAKISSKNENKKQLHASYRKFYSKWNTSQKFYCRLVQNDEDDQAFGG